MVLRLKSQAFLADFSRFDLGVALRLWDGDYRQKGLQEKLEVHYSPELSSALVEAVRKVEENDLPNAIQVIKKSNCPDYVMINSFEKGNQD